MVGYLGHPDATAAAFFPGDWLRTGDLGYQDVQGTSSSPTAAKT